MKKNANDDVIRKRKRAKKDVTNPPPHENERNDIAAFPVTMMMMTAKVAIVKTNGSVENEEKNLPRPRAVNEAVRKRVGNDVRMMNMRMIVVTTTVVETKKIKHWIVEERRNRKRVDGTKRTRGIYHRKS
jgi:Mg2+ and Co2+ transporter CorA